MKTVFIAIYDITLIGGAEKVALNLANELSKKNKVVVLSAFHQNLDSIVELNKSIKVEVLSERKRSFTINLIYFVRKVRKLIRNHRPTSFLGITAGLNTILFLSTIFLNTKTVYAEHSNLLNDQYGIKHRFRQYVGAKFLNDVVTLTETDRINFIKKYKIPETKVHTIYNWVEKPEIINPFKPSNKIVSVGRLVKVKGYNRIVQVAKMLSENHDFIWDIYGDGNEREFLENEIQRLKLTGKLNIKGAIGDINEVLNDYSIFVSTSTYEGMPLTFLEARNYNLPILSFDIPTGPREIINNGNDGVLIKAFDIEQMVEVLANLLEDYSLQMKLSKGISHGNDKFDKKKIISLWESLLIGD